MIRMRDILNTGCQSLQLYLISAQLSLKRNTLLVTLGWMDKRVFTIARKLQAEGTIWQENLNYASRKILQEAAVLL